MPIQAISIVFAGTLATLLFAAPAQAQVRVDFDSFEVSQNGSDVEIQYVISKEGWKKLGGAKAQPVVAAVFRTAKGPERKAEVRLEQRLEKIVIPAPSTDFQLMIRVRDKVPSTKRVVGMQFGQLKPSFLGFMSDEIPKGKTSGFRKTDAVRK